MHAGRDRSFLKNMILWVVTILPVIVTILVLGLLSDFNFYRIVYRFGSSYGMLIFLMITIAITLFLTLLVFNLATMTEKYRIHNKRNLTKIHTKILYTSAICIGIFFNAWCFSSLYIVYKDASADYILSFESNSGSSVDQIITDGLSVVQLPKDPARPGYTFAGWYWDDGTFDHLFTSDSFKETPINDNTTVYAKWIINQYKVNYYIFDNRSSVPLTDDETIIKVSLGGLHSSALTSKGRVFTWGDNNNGTLGDETTNDKYSPVNITNKFYLDDDEKIIDISLGLAFSSALSSKGRVFTWGNNYEGQLGDGTRVNKMAPKDITSKFMFYPGEFITKISLGYYHASALSSRGQVFSWGANDYGQLGNESSMSKYLPTNITYNFDLEHDEKVVDISNQGWHSTALTSRGRVYTWGNNENGQLGDATTSNKYLPNDITGNIGLNIGETIISISSGVQHTAALTSLGRVFTWGYNGSGALGDGTRQDKAIPTNITANFHFNPDEKITLISLGGWHSAALSSQGRIFTWGDDINGKLGDGTTINKDLPTNINDCFTLEEEETIVNLSLGVQHSAAITSCGRVFTWGENTNGKLGDGTTIHRSLPQSSPFINSSFTQAFTYNSLITEYHPSREGYNFFGWYTDANLMTPYAYGNMPADNLYLYGKWVPV